MIPTRVEIKRQITRISPRICELEYRIERLDTVFIPMSLPENSGRYRQERALLFRELANLYREYDSLCEQLECLSRV